MRIQLVLFVLLALCGNAVADSFEFLAYTPPKTWTKQTQPNGAITYTFVGKNNHGGMILLVPSVTPIGTPTEEFQTYWRANVDTLMKVTMPTPQSKPARDMTMVWGSSPIDVGGERGDVQVVMFVGRNSVLGTVTLTVGPEAVRDVAAFNASVKILDENRPVAQKPTPQELPARPALSPKPSSPASPAPASPTPATPTPTKNVSLAFEYGVPPGYAETTDNGLVWLMPTGTPVRGAACAYALFPPAPSKGLEKDVEAAMQLVPAGWAAPDLKSFSLQQKGVAPEGWPYWVKANPTGSIDRKQAGIVMALAFPAPNNQVSVVYGFGGMECASGEVAFERLFHSIKPKGWTSDGGKAFDAKLHNGYRYVMHSPQMVVVEYVFDPSGRYTNRSGLNAEFQREVFKYEFTYAGVGDGAWKRDRGFLTLVPDAKNRKKETLHVRAVTEYIALHWRDALVITKTSDDGSGWASTYYKILGKDEKVDTTKPD